jgi:hypothetical protein
MPYKITRIKTEIPLRNSNRKKSQILLDFASLKVGHSMENLTKPEYARIRVYASRYKVNIVGRMQADRNYTVWRTQ